MNSFLEEKQYKSEFMKLMNLNNAKFYYMCWSCIIEIQDYDTNMLKQTNF